MITEVLNGTIRAEIHDDGRAEILMVFSNGDRLSYTLSREALMIVPSFAKEIVYNDEKM